MKSGASSGSPIWVQVSKDMGHPPIFPSHTQRAELEIKLLAQEFMPTCDASATEWRISLLHHHAVPVTIMFIGT